MENEKTIRVLSDKRVELVEQLNHHQAAVRQTVHDIEHIDATLQLFGVGRDDGKILKQSYRGETAKIILNAIRDSKRGLTSDELAQRVLIERRMDPDNKKLVQAVAKRVRGCLQHYRRKGLLASRENDDARLEWSIA